MLRNQGRTQRTAEDQQLGVSGVAIVIFPLAIFHLLLCRAENQQQEPKQQHAQITVTQLKHFYFSTLSSVKYCELFITYTLGKCPYVFQIGKPYKI